MKATRFSDKSPQEVVMLEFDFSKLCTTVVEATVNVSQLPNQTNDPAVSSMLEGQPQITGAKVHQSVKLGLDGNDYRFDCLVTVPGTISQTFELSGILPVRKIRE